MGQFYIPVIRTTTEYIALEADSIQKAIERAEISNEEIVDYKRLFHDLIANSKDNQVLKTKKIRTILRTGFRHEFEFDDDIEYDGSQEDLEKKISELQQSHVQSIIDKFRFSWGEIE